jgi:DNA-binding transcriptional LysR family regulator
VDFQQVRYFHSVAELGSIRAAAKRWHASELSVRTQIVALEAELGVKLFDGFDDAVRLTTAGVSYRANTLRVLALHDEAVERGLSVAEGRGGLLRLGICEEAATRELAQVLRLCRQVHPDVQFQISEMPSAQLASALRRHELDFALMIDGVDSRSLAIEKLWVDDWLVVLPHKHALSDRAKLSSEDLKDCALVMAQEPLSSHGHALVRETFRRHGLRPRVVAHCRGRSTMLMLTRLGVGATFVTRSFVTSGSSPTSHETGSTFHEFDATPLTICGGYRAHDPPGVAMQFLRMFRDAAPARN